MQKLGLLQYQPATNNSFYHFLWSRESWLKNNDRPSVSIWVFQKNTWAFNRVKATTPNAKTPPLYFLRCTYRKSPAAKLNDGITYLIIIQFSPVIDQTQAIIQEISGGLMELDKSLPENQFLAFRR